MGSRTRFAEREDGFHWEQGGERKDRSANALCTRLEAPEDETANLLGDAVERHDFLWPGRYVSICMEAHGHQPRHPLNLFALKVKNYLLYLEIATFLIVYIPTCLYLLLALHLSTFILIRTCT
jgi:hypothetical protein